MSQFTGGSVEYERRIKTGDFEHKVLKMTLTFSVPEGESNSNMDEVARSRAILLVEQGLQTKVTTSGMSVPTASGNVAEVAQAAPVSTAPKNTRKKAAPPLTADVVEAEVDPAAVEGQVNGGKDRSVTELVKREPPPARTIDTGAKVDPAAMVFPNDSKAADNASLISGAVPSSGIDRENQGAVYQDEPVGPVVVTYKDLVTAATAAMSRGVNQENIRKLVATYQVQKLSEVADDKKGAILAEINQLK